MTLLLTRADLAPLLTEPDSIRASFEVIRDALRGSVEEPDEHQSWLAYPLGTSQGARVHVNLLASPWGTSVRVFPPPIGPTAQSGDSLAMLFDEQGQVAAILDLHDLGSWRTRCRSGGHRCARTEGARVAAMIGSGKEANIFLRALRVAMPGLTEVRVHSRTPANRERFAREMTTAELPVHAVDEANQAVEGADVIIATAAGGRPQFEASAVRPGATLATVAWGSVPPDLRARLVLPDRFQPEARPTGWEPWPIRRWDEGGPSDVLFLADVLRGEPARRTTDETLLYSQFGVFAWDAPLVRWAYEAAVQRGLGTEFSFT